MTQYRAVAVRVVNFAQSKVPSACRRRRQRCEAARYASSIRSSAQSLEYC